MYEKFERLLQIKNVTPYRVSVETGVSQATLSDWKNGKSEPKKDKMQKIADYFEVKLGYFYDDEQEQGYYLNDETKEIAQEVFDNPDLRGLFDIARDTSPERLKAYVRFLKELHDNDKR